MWLKYDYFIVEKWEIFSVEEKMLVTIFNSPEHKVLMVSFCDRPMSGVRRASSTISLNISS